MTNETLGGAAQLGRRGKELAGNGQYALAAVCYSLARQLFTEQQDSANERQMDLNFHECLEQARQHGQDFEAVKDLAPEVLLDNKLLQETLPSFSIDDLLRRARTQWMEEDYRGLHETVRECQHFLPGMDKELARQTRGYLDFYKGVANTGFGRPPDALPSLRAAHHAMKELLHVYGEVMWTFCLLYLGQALAASEPENAARYMQDAYNAFVMQMEQQQRAGKDTGEAQYFVGLALLELARFHANAVVDGNALAMSDLFRHQQEAAEIFATLHDIILDPELQARCESKLTHTLAVVEKCLDRIPPSASELLSAVIDQCEEAIDRLPVTSLVTAALVKATVATCQRAHLSERAIAIARQGRARVSDPNVAAWLDELISEFTDRQGLETQFAAAQQAINAGRFAAAYPALDAAEAHAQALQNTRVLAQIERLREETRLRDPGMVEEFLAGIRDVLRTGDFDEAERQLSRLRTAQSNNLTLAEFRDEIFAAKAAQVEQHARAMLVALAAGKMDGVETAQMKAMALARQLPAEPPLLYEARQAVARTLMQRHVQQAAECIKTGDFHAADDAITQARGAVEEFPELASELSAAEQRQQDNRQALIAQEVKHISGLIASGQFAEANVALAEDARLGVTVELQPKHRDALDNYIQARRRLIEARTLAANKQIPQADAVYRELLQDPVSISFREEVRAEYDGLKKEWGRFHAGEGERLTNQLRNALVGTVDFAAAREAMDGLDGLLPGSYDEKAVKLYRDRYALLRTVAMRHYSDPSKLTGTPQIITAVLIIAGAASSVLFWRMGWGFVAAAAIGLGLMATAFHAALCAVAKTTHAYTASYHPFSVVIAGIAEVLAIALLSLAKLSWAWAAGLVLFIVVFAITEFALRKAMPIRIPD